MSLKFRTKRVVTLPVFSFKERDIAYLRIEGEMHEGKQLKKDGTKAKNKPATICQATDLETGELVDFIVPAVVESVFRDEYDDGAYIGKSFEITKIAKAGDIGKDYDKYRIIEIEVEQ